ncbi:hypothetical protein [Phaeovulum sp.]|jgi:hypothetical protein|uniref:hypothetical protein n=1 Tax=Phaeovulum sp. TaxID=2934796 RepID=UPI002730A771|nr:hypothetical protein [Phaeovulum sp.]MDP1669757.1 hypothetical protein [Phaeovulum sp.]MDP2063262.1 hypothetical protein [Phaeovulum sp.]MDP3862012.1 hypothetical protein [Phaeovulum sp.]MDZ4119045.1 hypothetical protein [Phaeovulum sp.]
MGLLEDLADKLAADTLDAMEALDNDRLYIDVGKVLGTSSPTMQETFLTSIRIRLAERRGRRYLEATVAALQAGAPAPKAPRDSGL